MPSSPPPVSVIERFAAGRHKAVPLPGGQGESWRVGRLVLKRCGRHSDAAWLGRLLARLPANPGFRLAHPLPAADGSWVVDDWGATEWLPGEHRAGLWTEALQVSRALHAALQAEVAGRPEGIERRSDNPWILGDRVAWGERPAGDLGSAGSALLARLAPSIDHPWQGPPSQLIHGDLTLGNVLFSDDPRVAPAVIDFSPYWRPAGFALAVLVADALAWESAPDALATDFLKAAANGQELLARAVVFRVSAAAHLWDIHNDRFVAEMAHYERVAGLLTR